MTAFREIKYDLQENTMRERRYVKIQEHDCIRKSYKSKKGNYNWKHYDINIKQQNNNCIQIPCVCVNTWPISRIWWWDWWSAAPSWLTDRTDRSQTSKGKLFERAAMKVRFVKVRFLKSYNETCIHSESCSHAVLSSPDTLVMRQTHSFQLLSLFVVEA